MIKYICNNCESDVTKDDNYCSACGFNLGVKTAHSSSSESGAVSWLDALVETLRAQSLEIAREGHAGWGNTMTLAADALEKLQSDAGSASNGPVSHSEVATGTVEHNEET